MSKVTGTDLVGYLRREYRAQVVANLEDADDAWRCPSWVARIACADDLQPSRRVCDVCPVRRECLTAALVLDDPAPFRGGMDRRERLALFVMAETRAFRLDDWMRDRSAVMRQAVES